MPRSFRKTNPMLDNCRFASRELELLWLQWKGSDRFQRVTGIFDEWLPSWINQDSQP